MRGFFLALFFLAALPALAVTPQEMLADPVLEARAREISKNLRCLVCQNQSIDEFDADLAHDLRVIVRERLTEGDSDDQARAYVVARYGDYVLLDPPFNPATWALWLGPFAILGLGGLGVVAYVRRQARVPETVSPPLSPAEDQRLRRTLGDP